MVQCVIVLLVAGGWISGCSSGLGSRAMLRKCQLDRFGRGMCLRKCLDTQTKDYRQKGLWLLCQRTLSGTRQWVYTGGLSSLQMTTAEIISIDLVRFRSPLIDLDPNDLRTDQYTASGLALPLRSSDTGHCTMRCLMYQQRAKCIC